MKKIFVMIIALAVILGLAACGGENEDPSAAGSSLSTPSEAEPEFKTVPVFGIELTVPSSYTVSEGEVFIITSKDYPQKGDNVTVAYAEADLADFTEKNMTAALQTAFEFEKFNNYKKEEINGTMAVVYDFDTVTNGVSMHIKQLSFQAGENVVTVTYCLMNEEFRSVFEEILYSPLK